jgi:hypothetical protein
MVLIGSADIALSLHRGAGFGSVSAEAMLLRKPAIATGRSGGMDFMNEKDDRNDTLLVAGYSAARIRPQDPETAAVGPGRMRRFTVPFCWGRRWRNVASSGSGNLSCCS